jgi:hypothetical protein
MGDVIVITHARSVDHWARAMARFDGPTGTSLALRPVVIRLDAARARRLLGRGSPEPAFFAAWAVHAQRGRAAQQLVRRAFAHADRAKPPLRKRLGLNILGVLGQPLLAMVMKMLESERPHEGPLMRELRALRGACTREGTRGRSCRRRREITPATAEAPRHRDRRRTRLRIKSCSDLATIEKWFDRAVTASSAKEIFGSTRRAKSAPVSRRKTRTRRAK